MKERGIPFHEVNVAQSEANLRALQRKSGQTGVPVIDVNGTIVVGFNRPKLDRALGIRSV